MHVLRFGNKLNEEVRRGFIFANLFNSLYLLVRLWWNILVANLATNFQDLVTKVKKLVALAPVLGAISRPDAAIITIYFSITEFKAHTEPFLLKIYWFSKIKKFWNLQYRPRKQEQ